MVYLRFSPNSPKRFANRLQSCGYKSLKMRMKSRMVKETQGISWMVVAILFSSKRIFVVIWALQAVDAAKI